MRGIETYREIFDESNIEQLYDQYQSLVKKIALKVKKKLPRHIDLDDLVQSGYVGLLEARRNYRPDEGSTFESFAGHRIKGAIIDGLRKNSWATRESISAVHLIEGAIARLEQKLGRSPQPDEIAADLSMSNEEYARHCELIQLNHMMSIDFLNPERMSNQKDDNPRLNLEKEELTTRLRAAIDNLNENEKLVVSLYYLEELTMKQIGQAMTLSEARICQLHGQALIKLKMKIKETEVVE